MLWSPNGRRQAFTHMGRTHPCKSPAEVCECSGGSHTSLYPHPQWGKRGKHISFKPICTNDPLLSLEGQRKKAPFSSLFIDSRTPQWLSNNTFPVFIFYRHFTEMSTPDGGFKNGVVRKGVKWGKKLNTREIVDCCPILFLCRVLLRFFMLFPFLCCKNR